MVKLSDFINAASIRPELEGTTKQDVLQELSAMLLAAYPVLAPLMGQPELLRLLSEREKLAATGVGKGVAIPHAASAKLTRLYGGFARSSRGVEFGAIDGQPCHLFFVLMCPSAQPKLRIKALSRISRLLGDDALRQALRTAPTTEDVYRVLLTDEPATEALEEVTKPS